MSDTADDLIMQQGGTSDLDRAKRIINKQQAEIERLRADAERWRECEARAFVCAIDPYQFAWVLDGLDTKADSITAAIDAAREVVDE